MPYILYITSIIGGICLFLIMPRHGFNPRIFGALLGAISLGSLWLVLARQQNIGSGMADGTWAYYYVFSALAIGSAVRVITHTKPVYSALWFLMVVLASAGLLLSLQAEFMAFAMVIIYGGAILVTYVFVIMLAGQSGNPKKVGVVAEYDRIAREPIAAITVGFLLLAVLLSVVFKGATPNETATDDLKINIAALSNRPAMKLEPFTRQDQLDNVELVGLDLFESHPLGLELAGVILLVSLVGAVVIAKQRVEQVGSEST